MEQFKQNYQNQNERMNPQLESMLKSMQSDLAKNPAFPKTDANGNPINFVELIAYKRFLDVIEKVKRYTNLQNVTGGGLGQLSSMLMQGVQFIQQVEAPHKRVLENLAVDLVVEEMELPDGAFQFQCKLVPMGSINQDGFQIDGKEPSEEEINQAFQDISQNVEIPTDELFEDEKHKRRFINMLIQGSSKKGHYMFELVRRELNEYNPNLAETYGKVMSINDLLYWILDDETVRRMAESDSSMGGKEGIEEGEDGDTIIKTEAICFPISLHEIIKGVMEVFGTQGLPDDPQQANLVINAVDSLSNETMDLRLGVPCWEKIFSAYPDFILEEGNRYLQSYLFARYCALPTDEFFRVSRLILSDDPKGAKYFAKMVDEIQNDLQREDYEKNIDDINLDDLLGYKYGGGVRRYTDGGEIIFFDRHASMDSETMNELLKMTKYPFLEEYFEGQDGERKYETINSALEREGVSQFAIVNYLSGLFDGYNYSNTEEFKEEMAKLKLADKEFYDRIIKVYEKISKYPKINREYDNGGGVDLFSMSKTINDKGQISEMVIAENVSVDEFNKLFSDKGYRKVNDTSLVGFYFAKPNGDTIQLIPSFHKKGEILKYGDGGGVRRYTGGGGVNSNYGKFGDDNSNLVNFDIENLDAFEFRQYENYSKSISKAQALQVLINDVEGDYSQLSEELSKIAEEQMPMDKYNNGGMIDLFEDYENIPPQVQEILDRYADEFGGDGSEMDYKDTANMLKEIRANGYTFNYYLDNQPYGLRPIGVKLNELQGYEDSDDSDEFDVGGEAEFDVYNWDDKMALINLGQIYEYAIELDEIINEDTQLEEWVKMKLTRIEQNIADVKHSLEGWEKYSSGGQIAKKQLLHIAKYSKDLIEMISNGSKLMSWQEGKLSVSAQSIDDIYHHLDYKMGNRAVDLENESEDKFVGGGEVQGWMKEALLNLQLVENDDTLQISYTNENSFYVEGDYAEYRVFKTYDNAYDTAIEQVSEDLEENPDYFNQDWLFNWIDMDDTIENILEKYYLSYAEDIANEDDSKYNNRLIAEMVESGLMTEDEATSEDADDIAEDNIDNFVDLYVEENMQGDKGVEWYINNFGEDDFRNLIIDNNLIDISGASENAIDTDGVGHFLSSYDGIEIELDNDVVAYRTN